MRFGVARVAAPLLLFLSSGCAGVFASGRGISAHALVSAAPPPVDSADALRTARAAQSRFEIMSFARLPWTNRAPRAPRCDEIIGRFCLWSDGTAEAWEPPPEADEVVRGRHGLIAWLAAAEAAHPGDSWIVGQHVRYLVEAGRHDSAAQVSGRCRAERWWCLALGAYVRHARGDFAGSETAFDEALAVMPDTVREAWTDIRMLLSPEERKAWARVPAADRPALEQRFWHLADPFYSRAGNERRTEHFSRHVLARLFEDARAPDRERWGEDSREILLRYGAASGWERVRSTSLAIGAEPGISAHFANGGEHFLPTLDMVLDPSLLATERVNPVPSLPRTAYAPAYADAFHVLAHQLAVFRRGDSTLVAAIYEMPRDSLADTARVEAALVLATRDGRVVATAHRDLRGRRGTLTATAPSDALIASIEVLAPEARRAGRGRAATSAPWNAGHAVTLSDLLLISPPADPPSSLAEALPAARTSWRAGRLERVGLYWELYAPDTTVRQVDITLSLTREDRGWPRRLAERLGLRDGSRGMTLHWRERIASELLPRSVLLDLSFIEPGTYTLEMRLAGQRAGAVSRRIVITR